MTADMLEHADVPGFGPVHWPHARLRSYAVWWAVDHRPVVSRWRWQRRWPFLVRSPLWNKCAGCSDTDYDKCRWGRWARQWLADHPL